jgi:hypothetical protein
VSLAETQSLTARFLAEEAARRINWDEDADGKLSCAVSRFASESQIIREEALFLACDRIASEKTAVADATDSPPLPSPPPRRAAVRDFARKIARSLGDADFAACNDMLTAAPRKQKPLEECSSILINKPGVYRFKNHSIECIMINGAVQNYRFVVRELNG